MEKSQGVLDNEDKLYLYMKDYKGKIWRIHAENQKAFRQTHNTLSRGEIIMTLEEFGLRC